MGGLDAGSRDLGWDDGGEGFVLTGPNTIIFDFTTFFVMSTICDGSIPHVVEQVVAGRARVVCRDEPADEADIPAGSSTLTRLPTKATRSDRWIRLSLEGLEVATTGRRGFQLAVRRTLDAPPDGKGLVVQERVPVALAQWRVRHLLEANDVGAVLRVNTSPLRRHRGRVRGPPVACAAHRASRRARHRNHQSFLPAGRSARIIGGIGATDRLDQEKSRGGADASKVRAMRDGVRRA
jgi:hypothetical protein